MGLEQRGKGKQGCCEVEDNLTRCCELGNKERLAKAKSRGRTKFLHFELRYKTPIWKCIRKTGGAETEVHVCLVLISCFLW